MSIKVKRRFIIALILLVSVLMTGCFGSDDGSSGGNESSEVWNTYSNDYYGIKYPFEWEITYEEMNYIEINPNGDKSSVGFSVNVFNYPSAITDEDFSTYIDTVISTYGESSSITVIDDNKITLNGQTAHKVITVLDLVLTKLKTKNIYTYKDSNIYVLDYSAEESVYDDSLDIANEMIDSFEILK